MKGINQTAALVARNMAASVAGSWATSQIMGYNTAETRARLTQAFAAGLAQGAAEVAGAEGRAGTGTTQSNPLLELGVLKNPYSAMNFAVASGPSAAEGSPYAFMDAHQVLALGALEYGGLAVEDNSLVAPRPVSSAGVPIGRISGFWHDATHAWHAWSPPL